MVESTQNTKYHSARNVLILGEEDSKCNGAPNYWLAEKKRTEGQGFTMAIGDCKAHVPGVALKNIENRNWATKRFRISGALQPRGPWQPLLEQYVEDSRTQGSAPLQQFFFQEPTELHFLKFDLLDF